MPTSAPHTALSLYTLRERAGGSTETRSRPSAQDWPTGSTVSMRHCGGASGRRPWDNDSFGSFLLLLPSRYARAATQRRRSPRVCCVEDHVDDARRPQPRSPTLPPWVGWLGEKASPVGKHHVLDANTALVLYLVAGGRCGSKIRSLSMNSRLSTS